LREEAEVKRLKAGEVLRSLVKEIILTPENGALQIDVRGDLAGIFSVSLKAKVKLQRRGNRNLRWLRGQNNLLIINAIRKWPRSRCPHSCPPRLVSVPRGEGAKEPPAAEKNSQREYVFRNAFNSCLSTNMDQTTALLGKIVEFNGFLQPDNADLHGCTLHLAGPGDGGS
jgi:hypothetical protein